MNRRTALALIGSALSAGLVATTISATPAQARAACTYVGTIDGKTVSGYGTGRKMKTACRRARRRCERRWQRHNPKSACLNCRARGACDRLQ